MSLLGGLTMDSWTPGWPSSQMGSVTYNNSAEKKLSRTGVKEIKRKNKQIHLSVKRVKEHVIGAEPLGRVDSVDQETVF